MLFYHIFTAEYFTMNNRMNVWFRISYRTHCYNVVVKITSGFSYSPQKNALYPGNTTHRIAAGTGKGILLLFIALISFPYRFSPIDTGLDPSWIFAINYFFDNNFIFGRDVIWTYGPLGFLSYPLNVGVNLDMATGFQVCLWFGFLFTIGYVALTNRC